MLAPLGDVTVEDLVRDDDRRIRLRAQPPGHGLPSTTVFEYRERYRRVAGGWLRERYLYEYRPHRTRERRAHHDHPPLGLHQHCRSMSATETGHYADRMRLLEEVHEEFSLLYLTAAPIDCAGLLPLT